MIWLYSDVCARNGRGYEREAEDSHTKALETMDDLSRVGLHK